jgi:hypothetical protein
MFQSIASWQIFLINFNLKHTLFRWKIVSILQRLDFSSRGARAYIKFVKYETTMKECHICEMKEKLYEFVSLNYYYHCALCEKYIKVTFRWCEVSFFFHLLTLLSLHTHHTNYDNNRRRCYWMDKVNVLFIKTFNIWNIFFLLFVVHNEERWDEMREGELKKF